MGRELFVTAALVLAAPALHAEPCTAFVNLSGKGGYTVVDVLAGAKPSAAAARPGLSLGAAGVRTDVTVEEKKGLQKGPHGTTSESWAIVTAATGGAKKVWLDRKPDCPLPGEDDIGEFNCDHGANVAGVVGPFLSMWLPTTGFTGGAHEYDGSTVATLRAPLGQRVHVGHVLVGQLGSDAAQKAASALKGDEALDPPPDLGVEALSDAGLAAGQGLRLVGWPECCNWAQNHGMWEMDVALPRTPAPLQAWAPRDGAWPGPEGCGAVKVADGAIHVVRDGKASKVAALPAGASLVGISWLGAAPKVDEAAAKKALEEARAAVKEKRWDAAAAAFAKALAAKPDDPGILAEKGWAAFLAGDPAAAATASWTALSLTADANRQGAIYYNLGRIREDKGDVDGARAMYGRSLEVRPGNETVKARMQALYQ